MEEQWKDIPLDYWGSHYQASNLGNIRSKDRIAPLKNSTKFIKGRVLKPETTNGGYMRVILCRDRKEKKFAVHRLVAITWIGEPDKPQVNHINEDKTDNRPENLEWSTPSENGTHSYKNGLSKRPPNAKVDFERAEQIRMLYKNEGLSQQAIADMYGMSQVAVGNIVRYETYTSPHIDRSSSDAK